VERSEFEGFSCPRGSWIYSFPWIIYDCLSFVAICSLFSQCHIYYRRFRGPLQICFHHIYGLQGGHLDQDWGLYGLERFWLPLSLVCSSFLLYVKFLTDEIFVWCRYFILLWLGVRTSILDVVEISYMIRLICRFFL